ncbi:MAG: hypothetical protein E7679_01395 [Ruminococcaceae bacterium]|nr:hypothetical protein [Oscillospiraceae bacterium]
MKKDRSQNKVSGDGSYVVKKNGKLNILAFALCVLAAFFIWIYAMNTQNSNYTKTFSIDIEVINEIDLLDEKGLSVFGLPEEQVSITIQGTKADVQKYTEKEFRAYIDLSNIDEKGMAVLSVNVETPSSTVSVIATEPKTVTVYADEMLEKKIEDFGAYCDEEENYKLSVEKQESITVVGPKTYVEKIDSARVVIPYGNYDDGENISSNEVRIYDKDKRELSLLYITVTPENFVVKVEGRNGQQ